MTADNKFDIKHLKEPFEHFIFENFFTDDELRVVEKEFEFYKTTGVLNDNNLDGGATINGVKQVKRKSFFLSFVHRDLRRTSLIYKLSKKLFVKEAMENTLLGQQLHLTNEDDVLISQYNNGDYYKPHNDKSVITFILYLWNRRESSGGGELLFPDFNYKFNSNHNSAILFPSQVMHEVTPIVSQNKNSSRFSITIFFGLTLTPVIDDNI